MFKQLTSSRWFLPAASFVMAAVFSVFAGPTLGLSAFLRMAQS